jgi:hypothetical protein
MAPIRPELVWEMPIGRLQYRCELVDLGKWGIEAQIHVGHVLIFSQQFETRDEALAFALEERERIIASTGTPPRSQ